MIYEFCTDLQWTAKSYLKWYIFYSYAFYIKNTKSNIVKNMTFTQHPMAIWRLTIALGPYLPPLTHINYC